MRKRYIVVDNRSDGDVKACWTHAGATRWIKRKCVIKHWYYVEYVR